MYHVKYVLSSLIFIILGSACGGTIPAPSTFLPDPLTYHQALENRAGQISSISGELSVEIWENGNRVSVRQLFASMPPNRLRMDTLTPFDQPLVTVIYNSDLLAVHDREAGRFIMGSSSAENFERLTRLRLKPADMSALLAGTVPRLNTRGGKVLWDTQRGRAVLELIKGEQRQVISFDERDKTPRMIAMYEADRLLVRVLLADYTDKEPKQPRRLRVEIPQGDVSVNTTLIDYTLNPELPDLAFKIETPPGLKTQSF